MKKVAALFLIISVFCFGMEDNDIGAFETTAVCYDTNNCLIEVKQNWDVPQVWQEMRECTLLDNGVIEDSSIYYDDDNNLTQVKPNVHLCANGKILTKLTGDEYDVGCLDNGDLVVGAFVPGSNNFKASVYDSDGQLQCHFDRVWALYSCEGAFICHDINGNIVGKRIKNDEIETNNFGCFFNPARENIFPIKGSFFQTKMPFNLLSKLGNCTQSRVVLVDLVNLAKEEIILYPQTIETSSIQRAYLNEEGRLFYIKYHQGEYSINVLDVNHKEKIGSATLFKSEKDTQPFNIFIAPIRTGNYFATSTLDKDSKWAQEIKLWDVRKMQEPAHRITKENSFHNRFKNTLSPDGKKMIIFDDENNMETIDFEN